MVAVKSSSLEWETVRQDAEAEWRVAKMEADRDLRTKALSAALQIPGSTGQVPGALNEVLHAARAIETYLKDGK